jgi:hypothetical protein
MRSTFLGCSAVIVLLVVGCTNTQSRSSRPEPPWKTLNIQSLIDEASDGSTIKIPFGEYTLSKGLIINGRNNLILTSQPGTRILVEDTNADVLHILKSNGIQVKNLYLRHVKPLEEYNCHGAVIRLENSEDSAIMNCELNGCGAIGVSGWSCGYILVHSCFIHQNTFNAFYFNDCDEVDIQSSVVMNNGNFIQMYNTKSLEMRDNVLRNNRGYWKDFSFMNP